jgi:hypothetical protein
MLIVINSATKVGKIFGKRKFLPFFVSKGAVFLKKGLPQRLWPVFLGVPITLEVRRVVAKKLPIIR